MYVYRTFTVELNMTEVPAQLCIIHTKRIYGVQYQIYYFAI